MQKLLRSQTDYDLLFDTVIDIDPGLSVFINEVRQIRPPQHREWINLMPHAKSGNRYAYERIIEMYLRNVVKIALWHHDKYGAPLAEAVQDGCIGLMIALEKFELGKQDSFITYAPWWIRQVIERNMSFSPSPLFSFSVVMRQDLFSTYEIILDHWCQTCSSSNVCPALVEEVKEKLRCSKKSAELYIRCFSESISVEAELTAGNEQCFTDDRQFEEELFSMLMDESLKNRMATLFEVVLTDQEREVLFLRYGLSDGKQRTLQEVGQEIGLTRERIRQVEQKAFRKLRHPSRAQILKEYI